MNRKSKSLIYISLLVLAGLVLIFQSYSIVKLNQKVAELETTQPDLIANQIDLTDPDPAWIDPWNGNSGLLDPFTSMRQMQQRMDSLFGSVFQSPSLAFPSGSMISSGGPSIQVNETSDDYQIEIDIPQDSELELSTEVENNSVTLSGSINYDANQNNNGVTSSVISHSQFARSIPLGKPVDPLGLHTDKQDDKIVVTIPKVG